ncbi:unnamed protein product [Ostreobium quekettii]|uniref:Uncharacterized protein n=1 Tax=Ostreobium quekettii TaxID=121088 RepID=A0A8S1JCB8_9CHLO|nr:unnamed protein product [Ostreobium quekettii]
MDSELPSAVPLRAKAKGTTRNWLQKKFLDNFLIIGLAVAVAVALAWPYPGDEVSQHKVGSFRIVTTVNICTIFVISGLTLDTQDIITAITAFRSLAYGLIAILIITPTLGFGIVKLPFEPEEFAPGLAIFAAVPTTLSSGVSMVNQARGNTALALMLTIGSNLAGVATVPFTIDLIIAHGGNVDIDTLALLVKLLLTILLPVIVGKGLRELVPWLRRLAKEHKPLLSIVSNGSLVLIVWQSLSRSRDLVLDQRGKDVGIIMAAAAGMHLIYLVWNSAATVVLALPPREMRSVVLMASQKTLPVSLTVISFLDESIWDLGLLSIPCILGHLVQLLIDAVIVARWASMGDHSTMDTISSLGAIRGPGADDGTVKAGMMLVSNPLASKDPSGNGVDDGGYMRCNVEEEGGLGERVHGREVPAALQAFSMSSSSDDSFQSARTVFSTSTHMSPRGSPHSEPS